MRIFHGKVTGVNVSVQRGNDKPDRYVEITWVIKEHDKDWATQCSTVRIIDNEKEFDIEDAVSLTATKEM